MELSEGTNVTPKLSAAPLSDAQVGRDLEYYSTEKFCFSVCNLAYSSLRWYKAFRHVETLYQT